jgi:acetyl esterase/lipase
MIERLRAAAWVATLGSLFTACSSAAPAKGEAWESMDRRALDQAYNNSAAFPEGAAMFEAWRARSAQLREQHPEHLDLAYGPRARNRIDYFSAGPRTPVVIFFHGGFWQMRSKSDFSFLAESFLGQGVSVAMVGYPLAPEVSLDDIVADARAAVRYLAAQLPSLGGDPARMVVSGWSSGGHLAASVLDEPSLRGGVAISGIYELAPLVRSYVNDKLRLDAAAARRNSPMLNLPARSKPLALFAGSAELPEMRRQTADYARARRGAALPVNYEEIPGANHYTILNDMLRLDGRIHQALVGMAGDTPSSPIAPVH